MLPFVGSLPALRRQAAQGTEALLSHARRLGADEILVTNGLTQASFTAFMALLDEGDEAIVLEPYYPGAMAESG